jgi:hypothetical protein
LSEWLTQTRAVLASFKISAGIPYAWRRFECSADQLPDTYIVYFMVDDPEDGSSYDGKTVSHQPRVQISLYFSDKSIYLTIPEQIEAAFLAADFMRVGGGELPYQADTGHYGWYCDFRFYEGR